MTNTRQVTHPSPVLGMWLSSVIALLAITACDSPVEEGSTPFNNVELLFINDNLGGSITSADLEARVIAEIDAAQFSIDAAFEDLESGAVAQALVNAQARGVIVRVVGDEASRNQAGFQVLTNSLPASLIQFGDGTIEFSPAPAVLVDRDDSINRMTHNFLLIDEIIGERNFEAQGRRQVLINLSAGFRTDTSVPQLGFIARSEDIPRDFGDEFDTMFDQVFATTLTAFNGPLKSDSNPRWNYSTANGDLEIYFGPQERPIKRIVDAIYQARSSIFIMTEQFSNEFIADALIYKAKAGFDVRLIVDDDRLYTENTALRRLRITLPQLQGELPTIPRIRTGVFELKAGTNIDANIVIIDADPSPIDGNTYRTRVMVSSQPIVASVPFERINGTLQNANGVTTQNPDVATSDPLVPISGELFNDSNLWVLNRYPNKANPDVQRFIDHFNVVFNSTNATELPLPVMP